MAFSDYYKALEDPHSRIQIDFDGWNADYPSPANFMELFICPGVGVGTSSTFNRSGYCNRAFDELVARAREAERTDPPAARSLWQQAGRLLDSAFPFAAASSSRFVSFTTAALGNYQYSPILGPLFDQMWVH